MSARTITITVPDGDNPQEYVRFVAGQLADGFTSGHVAVNHHWTMDDVPEPPDLDPYAAHMAAMALPPTARQTFLPEDRAAAFEAAGDLPRALALLLAEWEYGKRVAEHYGSAADDHFPTNDEAAQDVTAETLTEAIGALRWVLDLYPAPESPAHWQAMRAQWEADAAQAELDDETGPVVVSGHLDDDEHPLVFFVGRVCGRDFMAGTICSQFVNADGEHDGPCA